jgi:hypothetical protein
MTSTRNPSFYPSFSRSGFCGVNARATKCRGFRVPFSIALVLTKSLSLSLQVLGRSQIFSVVASHNANVCFGSFKIERITIVVMRRERRPVDVSLLKRKSELRRWRFEGPSLSSLIARHPFRHRPSLGHSRASLCTLPNRNDDQRCFVGRNSILVPAVPATSRTRRHSRPLFRRPRWPKPHSES